MKKCPQCGQIFDDSVQFCPIDGSKPIPVGVGMDSDPNIGIVLGGKYRIESKVGEGGMGKIYLARHITLGKRYAVKMLNPEFSNNQEAIERFRREAVTAGELEHPNIINVTDIDYSPQGQAYIVMEFLDGRELRADMQKSPIFPLQRALRILYQVARALDAAHSKGIIHRDLKPENIFLIDRQDQKDIVKILDFGISKIKGAGASHLTQTGMVIGTPHYMAPEQARGDKNLDYKVDIYAMGCIAYEMLTGKLPYTGDSPTAILMKVLIEPAPPPESINPSLPPGVCSAIKKAMAKNPEERFNSCFEFVEAIKAGAQIDGQIFTTSTFVPPVQAGTGAIQSPYPITSPLPGSQSQQISPQTPYPVISMQSAQGGMGTGATPMTWGGAGGSSQVEAPKLESKKGKTVAIVIAVALVGVLSLAVAGYFIFTKTNIFSKTTVDNEIPIAQKNNQQLTKQDNVTSKITEPVVQDKDEKQSQTNLQSKSIIKFNSNPNGAKVVQKIGAVEKPLCETPCNYEFNLSQKKIKIVLSKDGFHDEEFEVTPDVPVKELIIPLTKKSQKKKSTNAKIQEIVQPQTNQNPPKVQDQPEKKPKEPVIKLIEENKKPKIKIIQ